MKRPRDYISPAKIKLFNLFVEEMRNVQERKVVPTIISKGEPPEYPWNNFATYKIGSMTFRFFVDFGKYNYIDSIQRGGIYLKHDEINHLIWESKVGWIEPTNEQALKFFSIPGYGKHVEQWDENRNKLRAY